MGKESPGGVPQQLVIGDHGETDEDAGRETHIEGEDIDVVCGAPRWRSSGFSTSVSLSQRLSQKNDWRDRLCLRVLLTPLDLRNVSFQMFNLYH